MCIFYIHLIENFELQPMEKFDIIFQYINGNVWKKNRVKWGMLAGGYYWGNYPDPISSLSTSQDGSPV